MASRWIGKDEKHVTALLSLAAKVSPTTIFVDDIDSMFKQWIRHRACGGAVPEYSKEGLSCLRKDNFSDT